MKKSLLFLSVLTSISMASCGGSDVDTSKIALDYGYEYKNDIVNIYELEIGYSTLTNKVDSNESFVLLIFNNRSCGCWTNFAPLAVQFMNKYNLRFYAFDNAMLEGEDNYGIYRGTDAMPGICFFRRGKLIRQSIYGKLDIKQRKFFMDYDALEEYMFDNIYLPKMYYIDKDTLEAKMNSTTLEFNLYVALKGCGDCAAINRDYISPWVDQNGQTTINDKLYIFDIYPYENNETTPNIRDFCWLSPLYNEKFGYQNTKHGYVPTFQRWKNGEVIDMITVLNDFADKDTGEVLSYFNQTRISNSPILSEANYHVYDKEIIDSSLINPWGTVNQNKQLEWHLPAVKLFFDAYVK